MSDHHQYNIFDPPKRPDPPQPPAPPPPAAPGVWFDGETFEPDLDLERLGKQMREVYTLMLDGNWRTLREISDATGHPEASVSARLRDLRKERWGEQGVERRRRGDEKRGLFEYRLSKGAP